MYWELAYYIPPMRCCSGELISIFLLCYAYFALDYYIPPMRCCIRNLITMYLL